MSRIAVTCGLLIVAASLDAPAAGKDKNKTPAKPPSERQVFFGAQPLHTVNSPDAFAFGTRPGSPRGIFLPGAARFYVSDLFVARWAFVGGGSVNAYFCYPLYYAACLLLAHAAGSPALHDVEESPGKRIVQR